MPRSFRHHCAPPLVAASRRASVAVSLAAAFTCSAFTLRAEAQTACTEWHAELTAVENGVEVKRAGETAWHRAASGDSVCYGDSISVKASSRAALTLPDRSTLRLDQNTTLKLTEPRQRGGSLVELLRGVIHVISRDPRSLSFTTPYANAGLEGTEFDIRVNERETQTEVVVLEGKVAMTTPGGNLGVPSGQVAIARNGQPPHAEPVQEAIDLMRWTGHFPRIIDRALPPPDDPAPSSPDADYFARRAAARLETAEIDKASADLDAALKLDGEQPEALGLKALLALARADHESALRLATAATKSPTGSGSAWLALSHAQEAQADLAGATVSAARAVDLEPGNALALSRSAALTLANGDATASIDIASRAARLAPARAEPHTVLGFAYLSRLNSSAARQSFERAAEIEPSAPLPRLGMGLALIQAGDLVAGRQEIEVAVALDPTNSLARSYMAKVYDAEKRGKLTASQLDLAKRFDPLDPTPWLYAAMEKLRANRPIEALQELQTASSKNGDHPPVRSRLRLDADLGTRSSSIANINAALGFDRLALRDAWQTVTDRPDDYAGHGSLADAYAHDSRQQIAHVSELFVAQLLQPANLTPIPAQSGQPSTFLAAHLGPTTAEFDELRPPLARNGLRLQASGSFGGDGTEGREVSLAGLRDTVSYGFGTYRFRSDGFRENNDRDERIANAFVQIRPAADTSLQLDLRSTLTDHGDLASYFNPDIAFSGARLEEASNSVRFGARHDLSSQDTLLAAVIHSSGRSDADIGNGFSISDRGSSSGVDVQLIHDARTFKLQAGVSRARSSDTTRLMLDAGVLSQSPFASRQTDLYTYATINPADSLTVTAGAAWNRIDGELLDEQRLNPKLGIAWRPSGRTVVRAAAFRSLSGALTTSRLDPQPRLEPTQVAGFGQLMFGGAADESVVRGVAVDHTLSDRLFIGAEASHRDTTRSVVEAFASSPSDTHRVTLGEKVEQAYAYWTPHERIGVSAKLEVGHYSSAPPINGTPLLNFSTLTVERLPIELRYFSPRGLTLGGRVSRIENRGMFVTDPLARDSLQPGSDRFWLLDAFVGYRLPNRRGLLSLNADNLLDRRFRFQDVDPEDPTLIPERLLALRFTLAFD